MSVFSTLAAVTLLEILEASAEAWWRAASLTGQLYVRFEIGLPDSKYVVQLLSELREQSDKLKLPLTKIHIDRIAEYASTNAGILSIDNFWLGMHGLIKELLYRLSDELGDRSF
jgi:hypothetical protein